MAAVTRQPFAPLDGARLQTLTSLKNRQNALTSSPGKRKAAEFVDTDDSENVDPSLSAKRSKGTTNNCLSPSLDAFVKPSTILITKSASSSDVSVAPSLSKASSTTPRPRSLLNPKSPASKHGSSITKSTPLSAPAGRSPTRGKRSGILSRRRTATSYSRVDPPTFGLSSSSPAPFSLDAALKGTIPSYASRSSSKASSSSSSKRVSSSSSSSKSVDFSSLHEPEMKSSWFFDIHEDTPEQEMTNLLQHSTCVLDISSDEESETRRQRERAEGKENVPPADDVSQTTSSSRSRARHADVDAMIVEKERCPLGEMDVKEYYSEGCDENSVVIVPGDDHEEEEEDQPSSSSSSSATTKIVDLGLKPVEEEEEEADADADAESDKTAEQLMRKTEEPAPCAAVLEPLEGTGESFEVWESGSAKDEAEGEC
ncbi:hypothetical protein F5X96DRAFT_672287 [Biscogniauxia mediterranea]|nr:hypothetical protein F5X96DRAFT_672287 [Biscogniauxia mediterranea]